MSIDTARQPLMVILLQFFLLLALVWCRYSLYPAAAELDIPLSPAADGGGQFLLPGDWLNGWVSGTPWVGQVASVLLIIVMQFIILRIMSRNLFFTSRTYLPVILFLLISCGFYFPGGDLAAVFAVYLLLCAASSFISSFVRSASFGRSFKGALLLGCAVLLHPSFALFFLLTPVAMRLFRRSARETLVAVIGTLLPLVAYSYAIWAAGGAFTWAAMHIWNDIMTPGTLYIASGSIADYLRLGIAAISVVLIILSVGTFRMLSGMMRTRAYKINRLMQFFLLLSLSLLLLPGRSVGDLSAVAIPFAFIVPAFFVRFHGLIQVSLYLILLISAFLLNTLPFI